MKSHLLGKVTLVMWLCLASWTLAAQQSPTADGAVDTSSMVPRLINYSGVLKDVGGQGLSGVIGVTFLLYKDEQGGAPLWMETQNVTADKNGRYRVTLGSTASEGLPADVFVNGEARWLGVQAQGQPEQVRVMLVSVPYAMKAGDAQTLGGLPVSAFALAGTQSSQGSSTSGTTNVFIPPPAVNTASITGTGTTDFLPLWTSGTNLGSSIVFEDTTHSRIGINTKTPGATLDVKGGTNIEGLLDLPATGTATSGAGKNSQAQDFVASSFNSGTKTAVNQTFQWQAEPTGNNTSSPSGTLNLLFGSGSSSPTETGLQISNKGIITFAAGQTLPTVTGSETVNGNLRATGSVSGATANFASTVNTGSQTVTGNITDTGNISATGSVSGQTATFSGNNTTQIVSVTQNSPGGNGLVATVVGGFGVNATATAPGAVGVAGNSSAASGAGVGVIGSTSSPSGVGVDGVTTGSGVGVQGISDTLSGVPGLFRNMAGGVVLKGLNASGTAAMFDVDSNGNLFANNQLFTNGTIGNDAFAVAANGNLSTLGTVSASAVTGSTATFSNGGNAIVGNSVTGTAMFGTSTQYNGVQGVSHSSAGTGVVGINDGGWVGVYGQVPSGASTGQGVVGESFGSGCNRIGCSDGVHGIAHTTGGAGVAAINSATGGTGMYASSPNGYGIVTDSNVQQSRTVGGWVKAMVYVDFNSSGKLVILNCFNGQASGAASTTPPCGFALSADSSFSSAGFHIVDLGFQVNDRFPMLTVTESGATGGADLSGGVYWTSAHCCTANQVGIQTYYTATALDLHPTDTGFYLFIF